MLYWNTLPVRPCVLDLPFLSPTVWYIYNVRAREAGGSFPEGGWADLYSSVVCSTSGRWAEQYWFTLCSTIGRSVKQ